VGQASDLQRHDPKNRDERSSQVKAFFEAVAVKISSTGSLCLLWMPSKLELPLLNHKISRPAVATAMVDTECREVFANG